MNCPTCNTWLNIYGGIRKWETFFNIVEQHRWSGTCKAIYGSPPLTSETVVSMYNEFIRDAKQLELERKVREAKRSLKKMEREEIRKMLQGGK